MCYANDVSQWWRQWRQLVPMGMMWWSLFDDPGAAVSQFDLMALDRPPLVITLGDPGGIGPEVVLQSLLSKRLGRPVVLIGPASLRWHPTLVTGFNLLNPAFIMINDPLTHPVSWIDPTPIQDNTPFPSEPNQRNGLVSYEAVMLGVTTAVRRKGVLVTAPICKDAWKQAGVGYIDHTTLLGSYFNCEPTMAFDSPRLRVCLVTVHIPLSHVSNQITQESICRCLHHAIAWMSQLGVETPRVAVAGLNPHAGEGGVLGSEEQAMVCPAINEVQKTYSHVTITGPIPADSLFYRAYQKEFDVVVALYHDQGLSPLKMVAFDQAVNVTLGIPIIRSSPDHGTAFDVAYQSRARWDSMLAAIQYGDLHGG